MWKLSIAVLITAAFTVNDSSIYSISMPALNTDSIHFSEHTGKKMLIVNTCLNSRYTYQLLQLEQLYRNYQDSLVVIAIPSNSFGHEPNDDSSIANQMTNLFDISFPIAAKSEVTGPVMSPLYLWLTQKIQNGAIENVVTDDFTKYLVDESGHLIGMFSPVVDPMSNDIQNAVKGIE